jgi:hypothetical protein
MHGLPMRGQIHSQLQGVRLEMRRARSVKLHWTGGRYLTVSLQRATITHQNEQEVQ